MYKRKLCTHYIESYIKERMIIFFSFDKHLFIFKYLRESGKNAIINVRLKIKFNKIQIIQNLHLPLFCLSSQIHHRQYILFGQIILGIIDADNRNRASQKNLVA